MGKMYLHFVEIGLTQTDEIHTGEAFLVDYPTQWMPYLLMLRQHQEPVHQQARYWPQSHDIPSPVSEELSVIVILTTCKQYIYNTYSNRYAYHHAFEGISHLFLNLYLYFFSKM